MKLLTRRQSEELQSTVMTRYIIKRLFHSLIVLFILTVFVFTILRLSGDPAAILLPADATDQQIQEMRQALGLDKPIFVQYMNWISCDIWLIRALFD